MHVLITGGSGLIGRALCQELVERDMTITVLSRNPERVTGLPAGVRVTPWDARSSDGLAGELERADVVVHLAGANIGAGRWTAARKRLIIDSRLSSGAAIAHALLGASRLPSVLVQASAVGYYGTRADEVLTEESSPGEGWLPRLVRQWEDSTAAVEARGVRRVIIRTGVVLSPRGGALAKMLPMVRLGLAGPLGGGRQWLPWIHIGDEVAAIRFLIERDGAEGVFNLTAPHPVTNAEYTRALARVLHRPAILPVPAWALRLVFGEMATILLDSQRVLPQRLLALGFTFRFPELEAALKDLLA